ncbi:MAG: hypothetical protein N3F10_05255 [Candidatus Bathyarchaeota archaeon]|nr:hypothetical protein [Candidatus Bathyarchaeota archaeon]MCX8177686.1 hypothetical protein [Candidatus Bathyarchaeota archaeon]MDW8193946.1 hypothetical protein [Nitrososphaerota archaeon]
MVNKGFNINIARSLLGKNVNLHLKDGSVIVNVRLEEVQRGPDGREFLLKCIPYGNTRQLQVPLKSITWMKLVDLNLIFSSSEKCG